MVVEVVEVEGSSYPGRPGHSAELAQPEMKPLDEVGANGGDLAAVLPGRTVRWVLP